MTVVDGFLTVLTVQRILSGGFGEGPIDRRPADPGLIGDLGDGLTFGLELKNLRSFGASRRSAAPVFPLGLRLGDSGTLSFEHDVPLELAHRAQDLEDEQTGRR